MLAEPPADLAGNFLLKTRSSAASEQQAAAIPKMEGVLQHIILSLQAVQIHPTLCFGLGSTLPSWHQLPYSVCADEVHASHG